MNEKVTIIEMKDGTIINGYITSPRNWKCTDRALFRVVTKDRGEVYVSNKHIKRITTTKDVYE